MNTKDEIIKVLENKLTIMINDNDNLNNIINERLQTVEQLYTKLKEISN